MPKRYKDLGFKDQLSYCLCIASFVVGIGLTIAGFIVNPLGEVSSSVLTSLGLFLSFTASVLGISHHYASELEKIKEEIRNNNNETNE